VSERRLDHFFSLRYWFTLEACHAPPAGNSHEPRSWAQFSRNVAMFDGSCAPPPFRVGRRLHSGQVGRGFRGRLRSHAFRSPCIRAQFSTGNKRAVEYMPVCRKLDPFINGCRRTRAKFFEIVTDSFRSAVLSSGGAVFEAKPQLRRRFLWKGLTRIERLKSR
jgi:hypothetical protein